MATAMTGDNESDYGWDLSPEDEQSLEALVSQISPPPIFQHPTALTGCFETGSRVNTHVSLHTSAVESIAKDDATASLFEEKSHKDFADTEPGACYHHVAGDLPDKANASHLTTDDDISRQTPIKKAVPRFWPLPDEVRNLNTPHRKSSSPSREPNRRKI